MWSGKKPAEGEEDRDSSYPRPSALGPKNLMPVGPSNTGKGSPDLDWATPPKMKAEAMEADIPSVSISTLGASMN